MEYTLISERRPDLTAIEQVLVNRGISENILSQYLRTSDKHLEDCSKIDRILSYLIFELFSYQFAIAF